MRLCGRRKWLPVLLLQFVIFVCCLFVWKVTHSSKHRPNKVTQQHNTQNKGWRYPDGCIDCHPLTPIKMSELDSNLLLVLVHSACKRRDRRDAIRDTWLSGLKTDKDPPIHYRFVLGRSNIPANLSQQLNEEAAKFGDMMILPDNPDTALDLTQRTIESFQLAAQVDKSSYILKCDEDSYVDIARVASILQARDREPPLYWGELLTWEIYTEGLYGEKQYTVCDRYLTYALGGGYVLSRDLMLLLVDNAPYLQRYVSEDVSMGAWLAPYNVERIHDTRFNTGADSRGCKEPYLVSHKLKPDDMYSYFEVYKLDGVFCSHRNHVLITPGHMYNWTVLPSKSIEYFDYLP